LVLGIIVYFAYGKYRGMFRSKGIAETDMGRI
jgi:hypothetical protein